MTRVDIERFTELADRLCDQLPDRLLAGLAGGMVIEERPLRRQDDPAGVYILGEYITDPWLGPRIALYYGSFAQLFGGEPDQVWADELWTTIKHELRHHIEGQAGLADLDIEDLLELERMRQDEREARRLERLKRISQRIRGRRRPR